jgi:Clp amino terminal domain, pathogenicity island component
MFEKFSFPARRVVFCARRHAGRSGSTTIDPEHLLLGILTEDRRKPGSDKVNRMPETEPRFPPFFSYEGARELRQQILKKSLRRGAPIPDSVDMAVLEKSASALKAAHEHAASSQVDLLDILWALASEIENSVSGLLKSHDVTVEKIEAAIEQRR